jgi:hypothetical protein
VLGLVQFLSIYCTSLSSLQQIRVSEYQFASFIRIASSDAQNCNVCPGFCSQSLALLQPTFAFVSGLFVLGLLIMARDALRKRSGRRVDSHAEHLLQVSFASQPISTTRCSFQPLADFCVQYLRNLVEMCSAYVLMPSTLVFVLNVRSSSFAAADSLDRAMIVLLPCMAVLLRALVIRQRVVQLSSADQKQLYVSSAFCILIATALSVSFAAGSRQSSMSFESNAPPQYIVLSLLCFQLIAQTIIRTGATEESIYDNTDWPWSPACSPACSAVFSWVEQTARRMPSSLAAATIATIKFFLLNYVVVSQVVMVIISIVPSLVNSSNGIEGSSVALGSIPLITCGALLLHNAVNLVKLLKLMWQSCLRR